MCRTVINAASSSSTLIFRADFYGDCKFTSNGASHSLACAKARVARKMSDSISSSLCLQRMCVSVA